MQVQLHASKHNHLLKIPEPAAYLAFEFSLEAPLGLWRNFFFPDLLCLNQELAWPQGLVGKSQCQHEDANEGKRGKRRYRLSRASNGGSCWSCRSKKKAGGQNTDNT